MSRLSNISVVMVGTVLASGLGVVAAEASAIAPRRAATAPVPGTVAPTVRAAPRPEPISATDVTDLRWRSPQEPPPPSAGTYVVDLPTSGRARAGDSPISVGRSANARGVSRVRVRTLSADEVQALGGRFVAFEVVRADRGPVAAPVALALDYSAFERAFGGDFAMRLRIVERRACAVVRPDDPACEGFSVVRTRNDITANVLTADVTAAADPETATAPTAPSYEPDSGFGPQAAAEEPLDSTLIPDAGDSTVMTMSSTSSGQTGDFKATPFQPSNQWQVGVSSGGFSYSYPIPLPPPVAGTAPSLSFNYSSQSVDGRTSSSHAQVSQAGQGWSFDTGYIERRFASCSDDGMGSTNGDLCWKATNEYFLNFNGRSDQIFRYGSTNEWRLRDDPAWRVLSFTGAPNGDNDGEYFVVITPDGTKHWFGSGTEAGGLTPRYTDSTYTVPVTAGSNEPCYSAVAATSWCQQAWRWNVDRSQDTNENVVSYFYAKERNYYLRAGATTATEYVRGGYPTRIEYSSRVGGEAGNDPSVVVIDTGGRCVSETTACPAASPSTASDYPDVPTDLICASATSCSTTDHRSPSFFSDRKIRAVRTWIHNGTAYAEVTRLDFDYSFPDHTDGTDPSLWLQSITRTGKYGGSIALPPVKFSGTLLTNRVNYDATGGVPATKKFRVGAITTELGGKATVTYDDPYPCDGNALPQWDVNTTDCFPQWTTIDGSAPGWVAFRKYLVTKLVVDDTTGPSPSMTTQYVYLDKPAWHHDNSILTPADRQSWSQYRGHAYVQVIGDPSGATARTEQRHLTFRGMHGDKLSNGTTRSVALTDSTGTTITDDHYLQSYPLETRTYEPGEGHTASKLHRYWRVATITGPAGTPRHDTVYVRESSSIDRVKDTASSLGTWRTHEVQTSYDSSYANPTRVLDRGDEAVSGDEICTEIAYAANVATSTTSVGANAWLVNYPYRRATYDATTCGGTSPKIALTETLYDNHTKPEAEPTDGNVTETWAYSDAATKSVTKTGYDAYGRITSTVSPNEVQNGQNRPTTITYSPATGYPLAGVTAKNPLGHQTTTKLFAGWGKVSSVTDANGFTTTVTADSLGRTVALNKPGDGDAPSLKFDYALSQTAPSNVSTRRLISGDRYVLDGVYLDSLGRVVQTETNEPNGSAAGRLLTQTRYDAQGRVAAETDPFGNGDNLGSGVGLTQPTSFLETRYGYDSAGRRSRVARYVGGVEQFATVTRHHGTWHTVDAPVRADVDHRTDVWGRTWKITEDPAGIAVDTAYGFTPFGDLAKITDDAGNVTQYTHDWLRRRTTSVDPDAGSWRYGYDRDSNLTTTVDARDQVTANVYDAIGRRIAIRADGDRGPTLARWTYDTAVSGIGQVAESTRFGALNQVLNRQTVTAYDGRGRRKGHATTVESGPHLGTYEFSYTYDASDNLVAVTMPAAGGLPQETVSVGYNAAGRAATLTGAAPYIGSTTYRPSGQLAARTINSGAAAVERTFGYDSVGHLSSLRTMQGTITVEALGFNYDAGGNVTSIQDSRDPAEPDNECFRYDGLERLTRAWVTDALCSTGAPNPNHAPTSYDLTFAYDAIGNMTSANRASSATTSTTTTYTYGGPQAHAATSIGGATYHYDANGALVTASSGAFSALNWNELRELTSVTAGDDSSSFAYDADGERLIRKTGPETTLYLEGMEIRHTEGAAAMTASRYYGTVAVRTSSPSGTTVTTLLRNNQGSIAAAVDDSGIRRQKYEPFGARRGNAALPTERGFLGKTEDPTGLVFVGARYYDSAARRFVSPDALLALDTPQTLAAYSYAINNPVTYSDPSGLMYVDADAVAAGSCAVAECSGGSGPPTPNPQPQPPPDSSSKTDEPGVALELVPDTQICSTPSPGGAAACGTQPAHWHDPNQMGLAEALLTLAASPVVSLKDQVVGCAALDKSDCASLLLEAATLGAGRVISGVKAANRAIRRAKTFEDALTMLNALPNMARVSAQVERARAFLGPGGRVIINKQGDYVFMSEDGLRKIRVDLNDPSPHLSPHAHVEMKVNGRWVKIGGQLYPIDVPHH